MIDQSTARALCEAGYMPLPEYLRLVAQHGWEASAMINPPDLRIRAQAALGPLEITLPPDLAFEIHISAIQSGMTPQELVIDILRDLFRVSETEAASTAQVA